jgi:iron complex outermembrane receptor protein
MFRTALMRGASAGALSFVLVQPLTAQVALPPIDIDAERTAQPSSTLGSTEVTEEALFTARPAYADTTQLLGNVPGVSFYEAGGVSRLPVLRGLADDRIKILIGGQEITSACGNHMNPPLSYIDPNNVGKIEVLSGVTPVSKGGDSIAGTVVVEPKLPIFASQGAAAQHGRLPWNSANLLTSGSISTFYRSTDNGITISGTANAATENVSVVYNGSYTRGTDYHAGADGPKVRSTGFISENHSATIAYQNDGHLFTLRGGYQNIPYQAFPNQRMDMTGNRSYSVEAGYKGAFEWGSVDANAFWRHTAHKMGFLFDKLPANMPMNTSGTDYGYSIKAEIPLSASDVLRLGNEFHGAHLNDWWPPIPGSMMMGPFTYWNIRDGQRDRVGSYAEWEARWSPQWSSLIGVRNDTVWTNAGNVQAYDPRNPIPMGMGGGMGGGMMMGMANPDATAAALFNSRDRSRTDVNFDLTALLRYAPDQDSAFELGYSRKTRSPNLYERYAWGVGSMAAAMIGWFGDANGYIGNPDLKPEVAHTVSFTGVLRNEDGEVKVTPFFSYVENFIDADPLSAFRGTNGAGYAWLFPILQFRNHKAQLVGVDASGRLNLWDSPDFGRFAATAVLSYVHGTNLDRNDGLYHIMPLNGKVALEHRLGGWSNVVEVQLVDAKSNYSAARLEWRTPGYALLNLRSSYEWEMFRFDVGIENVTDKLYYSPLGGFAYADFKAGAAPGPVPGRGRSYYAGVTLKF